MKKRPETTEDAAPTCPKCKNGALGRVRREGLLETKVYPKAGLYPWECPICRSRVFLKSRGAKVRRKRGTAEETP